MDRYPDRRSLLWTLPGDRRKRLLDHAEERLERHPRFGPSRGRPRILMRRLAGRHAVLRVFVVWVVLR